MSSLIRGDAEVYSFVVHEDGAGDLAALSLPKNTRIICLYRDDRFTIPEQVSELKPGDEVILITHRDQLPELKKRWAPQGSKADDTA
jgi:trk system potassium uptake protein TrkA